MSTVPSATINEVYCGLAQYLQANIVLVPHNALTASFQILSSSPFSNDANIRRYAV